VAAVDVEIFLPVYNEAESIEATIREIYTELSSQLRVGFIICEDGSRDNTRQILERLAKELPLRLNLSPTRRGYSRAVRDGMAMLQAPYLLCLDSDGQCDPKDFWALWKIRRAADLIVGWRTDRQDTFLRKTFSRFFYLLYRAVLHVPVHDPSCPYLLMPGATVDAVIGQLGLMEQGFWWEFLADVHGAGLTMKELPVHHRLRAAGVTQIYKWNKMPGIFLRHVVALFQIRAQSRKAERLRASRNKLAA
jgi:dolichol-phosphate mannosyltransferase